MHTHIVEHFRQQDPQLYALILQHGHHLEHLAKPEPDAYVRELCESIVSQQLSVMAARTIWMRTHKVITDWRDPLSILAADTEALRACGMSYQKIRYVKNIADAVLDSSLDISGLDLLSDEEVVASLIQIKGIGRWTAEMFLLFTLARPDIFSAGDLGLRNAIDKLYGTKKVTPAEAIKFAEKWAPYRSTASRLLWKSLDNTPT